MIHVPPSPRSNMLFGQQQPTSTTINANYQRYRDSLTNRHLAGFTVRDTGRECWVEHINVEQRSAQGSRNSQRKEFLSTCA